MQRESNSAACRVCSLPRVVEKSQRSIDAMRCQCQPPFNHSNHSLTTQPTGHALAFEHAYNTIISTFQLVRSSPNFNTAHPDMYDAQFPDHTDMFLFITEPISYGSLFAGNLLIFNLDFAVPLGPLLSIILSAPSTVHLLGRRHFCRMKLLIGVKERKAACWSRPT